MPTTLVGTAAVFVVGSAPGRVSMTFRNDSSNDIYLGTSSVSTVQYDYHLKAGDALNVNRVEDGDMATRSWYAIASGATSTLSYMDGNACG